MRLFAFFIVSFLWMQSPQALAYQALKKKIEQTYGIQIEFDNIEFPAHKKKTAKAHHSSKQKRKNSLKNLLVDLEKYNPSLIKEYVKKVYLVKELKIKNVFVSGTYEEDSRALYLREAYLGGVKTNKYATVFHHELSSLLILEISITNRPYVLDFYERWTSLNPESFSYFFSWEGGWEGDIDGHPKFYKQGFVMGYGTTSFENDFNTFFELMMGDPVRLSKLESKYPAIRKKAELLRQFYYGTVLANIQLTSAN